MYSETMIHNFRKNQRDNMIMQENDSCEKNIKCVRNTLKQKLCKFHMFHIVQQNKLPLCMQYQQMHCENIYKL
jgi:hypothetical protein